MATKGINEYSFIAILKNHRIYSINQALNSLIEIPSIKLPHFTFYTWSLGDLSVN